MGDVSKGEGRTVLFVSHNMAAVKELCNQGILLNQGRVEYIGNATQTVIEYQKGRKINSNYIFNGELDKAEGNENIRITKIATLPTNGEVISISSGFYFEIDFFLFFEKKNLAITIELRNAEEIIIFHHGHWIYENKDCKKGAHKLKIYIPENILNVGLYNLKIIFAENYQNIYTILEDACSFEIENETLAKNSNILPGITRPKINYEINFQNIL